jgi:hypothetical protein
MPGDFQSHASTEAAGPRGQNLIAVAGEAFPRYAVAVAIETLHGVKVVDAFGIGEGRVHLLDV